MRQNQSPSTGDITGWSERLSDKFHDAATHFAKEMEIREHVHQTILDAIQSLFGLEWTASAGEFNTGASGTQSPLDRLYGGVAVEWEVNMRLGRREHGADQALVYLRNLRTNHPAADAFTAVVTDGKHWGFLRHDPDDNAADPVASGAPDTQAGHFTWVPNSPGACRQFLELIGAHKQSPITSKSLTSRFGPDSAVASRLVTVLSQNAAGRLRNDRTDTLYTEWRRALDVVYGDLDASDGDLAESVQAAYRMPIARPLGELLFVLHTYFALVGRVLAVELLAVAIGERDDAPSSWRGLDDTALLDRLRGLEKGDLPGDLEITNLFEADLFSWWADRAVSNTTLLTAIRDLLKETSELAFPRIAFGPHQAGDVLRDLYQALIPNKLRKALGEFLTPHWLAEACLSRLRSQGADLTHGRVLDPTCGTGTFILPVLAERLSRLAQERGDTVTAEQVQAVLDSVTGIDLNPVAITATRVNYVLALGDLANVGPLTLPVWRADSLIVPEPPPMQTQAGPIAGIVHFRLETSLAEPFTIPASMTTAARIARLRTVIEDAVLLLADGNTTEEDLEDAHRQFAAGFVFEFGPAGDHPLDGFDYDEEAAVAQHLFGQVATLACGDRNGVWARLIENAFAPLFAGTFDVVVGNPPWLTWTKLPKGWRDKSESLWKKTGLWHTPAEFGDTFSLQSGDIATLVFAVSLMRYARDESYVGLLVPNALINADPGSRAFRQFRLRPDKRDQGQFDRIDVPFRAIWLDDWSHMNPFAPDAANKPVFLMAKKGEPQPGKTPGSVWTRLPKVKINKASWRMTRPMLLESEGSFSPIDSATPTSAWRFQNDSRPMLLAGGSNTYTFGTGLHTRGANGIFFVEVNRFNSVSGSSKATVRIVNSILGGRNSAVSEVTGDVEADLVYPLLRGKDVQHWVANPAGHIVLPHDPTELDQVLTTSALRKEYPKALQWLRRNKDTLARRVPPPTGNWNMTASGNDWCRVAGALQHMQSGYSVVVRELSTRPAAALVEARFDTKLKRVATPLIDHKLMLCTVRTRDEALYLVAMVNSTPMQDLLESFVNSTSVSPKSMKRLPIPNFDASSPDMKSLVNLAAVVVGANDSAFKAVEAQPEMDAVVLRVVAAAADYEPQPSRPRRGRPRRPAPRDALELFEM